MSIWPIARTAPYTMPITDSVSTTGVNHLAAPGNSSRQNRSMPYVPTLSSTPTSSTAAPAGA
jgi:hypothetical protein